MYCKNCGKELPDGTLFCMECGAKQEQEQNTQTPVNQTETEMAFCINCGKQIPAGNTLCPECQSAQVNAAPAVKQLSPEELEKRKKKIKKISIISGVSLAVCAIAIVVIILLVSAASTINLNNYMTISFEGYDTAGKAVATFDKEKFANDYEQKLSEAVKSRIKNKYSDGDSYLDSLLGMYNTSSASSQFLSSCVDGDLDKESGLSNGDVVKYTWECDEKVALEVYGFKIKYENIEATVEGLQKAETFDPFDGLKIAFEGSEPDGTASIEEYPNTDIAGRLNYNFDNRFDLSNGDTVTVTISAGYYDDDPVEYCIKNYGMIPSPISKTYTVSGLSSYVKKLSEISEDSLKEMKDQAADVFNTNVARNWEDSETLTDFTYLGNYLLTSKDSSTYGSNKNALYLVYQAQVRNKYSGDGEEYDKTSNIFWYIRFNDLMVNKDGSTKVNLTIYTTPSDRFTIDSGISSGFWGTKTWEYNGYQTLDELYKKAVTSNSESYKHEDNVNVSLIKTTANGNQDDTEEENQDNTEEEIQNNVPTEIPDNTQTN